MTENLPSLITRAGQRLLDARDSAEVMEAKRIAEAALHYAKVTKAANDTHADCLRIITRAEMRMADEVDRGQANGEITGHGGDRSKRQGSALEEVGVDHRRLSEWREVRDAGEAVVEQALQVALAEGRTPTKAEILAAANRIKSQEKQERREERQKEVAELAALCDTAKAEYDLYNEPCINAMRGDPASVDWVITDPPYPKEFLPVYDDLGRVAAHSLKPGGSLLCMVGQSYLPDVVGLLGKHLTYHWTLVYLTPGGQATQLFPRKVNTFWKPVLWFVKGEYDGDWIGDVCRSQTNDNDKRFHEWGQSESGMHDLMSRFVKPMDIVLDPFMGAGTTGVIALSMGARFFGFDNDLNAFNEAVVRLDRESLAA